METNRLQKVLKSTASFVTYRFCHTNDVINLKWLTIAERINYHQLKLAHKAIYEKTFPNYLKLAFKNRNKRLRKIKNNEFKRLTCKDNIFHGSSCSVFYRFTCSGYAVQCFTIPDYLLGVPHSGFVVPCSIYSHSGISYLIATLVDISQIFKCSSNFNSLSKVKPMGLTVLLSHILSLHILTHKCSSSLPEIKR